MQSGNLLHKAWKYISQLRTTVFLRGFPDLGIRTGKGSRVEKVPTGYHHSQSHSGGCQESQEQKAGQGREDGSYDNHGAAPPTGPRVNGIGGFPCTHRNHAEAVWPPQGCLSLPIRVQCTSRLGRESPELVQLHQPGSAIVPTSSTLSLPSRLFPPVPHRCPHAAARSQDSPRHHAGPYL